MNDMILYHGTIITMEEENQLAQAVYVVNGRIQKIGTEEEVFALQKQDTQMIDLQGQTLLPGFIDSHSHITAFAQTLEIINISHCSNFTEIIQTLKQAKEQKQIAEGEWILGFGYDPNFLVEKKQPDKDVLDQVSSKNPVLITHVSGHMGVVNSMGLEKLEIDANTPNPEGGMIGRQQEGKELTGYLEENAFFQRAGKVLRFSQEKLEELLEKAQTIYFENGITTCQDGLTKKAEFEWLKSMAEKEKLKIDIISYMDLKDNEQVLKENKQYQEKYKNHLKIGGYKIILDGSPQGKTAWLSKPYEGEIKYRGYPAYQDDELVEKVQIATQEKQQLLAHCNGDQAAKQFITVVDQVQKQERIMKRPVMIHAQTVTKSELEQMKQIGILPSFFITHVYYWGDIHLDNLADRAYQISPAGYANKIGLPYTFHQDTPVLQPNLLETVWVAVNRITKNGVVLGEEEKLSVYDALKAITIYGAYQYLEEDQKGSIKQGKIADFVVLDKNPLLLKKQEINNCKVMMTIKQGEIVYQNKE